MLILAGCTGKDPTWGGGGGGQIIDDTGDTAPPVETACLEAEARLGERVCVHEVPDEETWEGITLPSGSADQVRVTKHLVPARPDARLPGLLMDVNAYRLHYDFLVAAFPDDFAGLTGGQYNQMILDPESREFYAGTVALYRDGDETFHGFTVWDDPADASATITLEDVTAVFEDLQARFDIGALAFVPGTLNQQQAASGWHDAPFEIRDLTIPDYEAYTIAAGFGTVRLYSLAELEEASQEGAFGFQDVLVLDEAPIDVERVIAGAVTGTRQAELSHLAVRSAARGTPNCYLRNPRDVLGAWEGQLVRLACEADGIDIRAATVEEASAWWESIRPDPLSIPAPDLSTTAMPGLLELATATEADRDAGLRAYGAKGTNLATLYQRIDPQWQIEGFLVPVHYYDAFMRSAGWEVDLGAGPAWHSFAETITAWLAEDRFRSDAAYRREQLDALRDAIDDSEPEVDAALLEALGTRILDVWGNTTTMVRFRSSSNAEDALEFSGAGLYESKSACLADELDGDEEGPSHCDPSEDKERDLRRALVEVWASLWNMAAFEEREWYGIDHSQAVMGILVDTRAADEQANIVAFTGNPTTDGDDRYLVNAQVGDLDVVSAEPGVLPEKVLLTVESGEVTAILRVSPSSETGPGEVVLTDAQLEALGEELAFIATVFPVDGTVPEGRDLLLDTEWKVWSDGRLIIKQVRPYLR